MLLSYFKCTKLLALFQPYRYVLHRCIYLKSFLCDATSKIEIRDRVNILYKAVYLIPLWIYINHILFDSDSQTWLGIRITWGAF